MSRSKGSTPALSRIFKKERGYPIEKGTFESSIWYWNHSVVAIPNRYEDSLEVIENFQETKDEGDTYESIEDIWSDHPSKDDFIFNEDEY